MQSNVMAQIVSSCQTGTDRYRLGGQNRLDNILKKGKKDLVFNNPNTGLSKDSKHKKVVRNTSSVEISRQEKKHSMQKVPSTTLLCMKKVKSILSPKLSHFQSSQNLKLIAEGALDQRKKSFPLNVDSFLLNSSIKRPKACLEAFPAYRNSLEKQARGASTTIGQGGSKGLKSAGYSKGQIDSLVLHSTGPSAGLCVRPGFKKELNNTPQTRKRTVRKNRRKRAFVLDSINERGEFRARLKSYSTKRRGHKDEKGESTLSKCQKVVHKGTNLNMTPCNSVGDTLQENKLLKPSFFSKVFQKDLSQGDSLKDQGKLWTDCQKSLGSEAYASLRRAKSATKLSQSLNRRCSLRSTAVIRESETKTRKNPCLKKIIDSMKDQLPGPDAEEKIYRYLDFIDRRGSRPALLEHLSTRRTRRAPPESSVFPREEEALSRDRLISRQMEAVRTKLGNFLQKARGLQDENQRLKKFIDLLVKEHQENRKSVEPADEENYW